MPTTSERIKQLMDERNLRQVDILSLAQPLCESYHVKHGKSDLSQFIHGKTEPGQAKLFILALTLGVSEAWLMGYDVPRERPEAQRQPDNVIAMPSTRRAPRLGTIACGEPILAEQNIEDYDDVPAWVNCDFTLVCKGDSMIGARITDGDVVCIRQQPEVENGQIAAVIVEDGPDASATLKRVRFTEDGVILWPENPAYAPLVFTGAAVNKVKILGLATHFISAVK